MRFLLSLSFLLLAANNSIAQFWIQHGSSATNSMSYAIAVDNNNNTYSTGYFSGTITFDATVLTATGPIDMFIVKTDPNGNILWAKTAGGSNITQGLTIAVNSTHLVVSGFFYSSSTFDAQSITSAGQKDVFLAKYDLNGNLQWVKSIGGTAQEQGNKVAFDAGGNILLTGEFSSTNFQSGSQNLSAMVGSLDVFTTKFDGTGTCLWAKAGSSTYIDRGTQITSDASGNVYVAGEFSDTVIFDLTHFNVMYNALFVIKYSAGGQEQWFRYMGSGNTVKFKGLEVNNAGEIIGCGNFTSSLFFFDFPTSLTLSNTYLNNFFVCKITSTGDLSWAIADGSNAPVSSECMTITPNQTILVGGTYQCRFDDFSAHYGTGVFCSIGYNDCFTAAYDQAGTWQWAKCFGGNKTDYLFGLASDAQNRACLSGAFETNIFFPENNFNFLGYQEYFIYGGANYCNDQEYFSSASYTSPGNSDVYIGKPLDPSRNVFDWFNRTGTNCVRDFIPICINNCEDTLQGCGNVNIYANTFTQYSFQPEYHYLWNTGDTLGGLNVTSSGYYWVTVTSYDGCWTDRDSIYVVIHPIPADPPISDDHGINSHSVNPQPIIVCLPDTVVLTGDTLPGHTYAWSGFANGVNPVSVTQSGQYTFSVTNSFGCIAATSVFVQFDAALTPIDLRLVCVSDSDYNDTVTICANERVTLFAFDTLSNPSGQVSGPCIPQESLIRWTVNNSSVFYSPITMCPPSNDLNFLSQFPQNGWYHIDARVVRQNTCNADSFDLSLDIYVIINPIPPVSFAFNVTGNTFICPGQSTTMYASPPGGNFSWSGGQQGDSATFNTPGFYQVSGYHDSTNVYGCYARAQGSYNFQITTDPLPVVTSNPASALICPFDSVQLICSGTGVFTWQGPNGTIPVTGNNIWVTTPGLYYAIRDDALCILNSNNLEVYQYNTPLIVPLGGGTICNNQPDSMQIITGVGSVITWQAPLSGNSPIQVVTQPGTYSCIVTVCNINTPLSLTFPGSNPQAAIANASTPNQCEGDTAVLTSGYASHYLWLPTMDTTQSIIVTTAGTYFLTITDSLNCQDTASVTVSMQPNLLTIPFCPDSTICLGDPITLVATGNSTVHWLNSSQTHVGTGYSFNPGMIWNNTYYLLYSDSGGCTSGMDTAHIEIIQCDTVFIPNVFTPGGDGFNDLFPGENNHLEKYTIKIFNRWGKLMFDSGETVETWNGLDNSGNKLADGTYYFVVHIDFLSGRTQDNHGWVQLINE